MTKLYAGIGSRRRTPSFIFDMMSDIASKLETTGYILCSGGAQGADKAFESGVQCDDNKKIVRAKHATIKAIDLAAEFHPYWGECNHITRKLHGRNSMIILGDNLDTPVQFVICYTPDGKATGGTGVAIRIAEHYGIPVFNLFKSEVRERLDKFIGIKREQFDVL